MYVEIIVSHYILQTFDSFHSYYYPFNLFISPFYETYITKAIDNEQGYAVI